MVRFQALEIFAELFAAEWLYSKIHNNCYYNTQY